MQVIILKTRDVKLIQYSDSYEDDEAEMLAPVIEKLDLQFGDYECIFKSYDLDKFEEIKKTFMNSKMFFFSDNNLYNLIYDIRIVDSRPDDKSFYMKDRKFYINVTFLDSIIRIRGCSLTKKEQSKSFQFVKNGTTVIGNVPVRSINNVQYIEYKYYVENILPNLLYSDEFIEPDMSF